MRNFFTLKSLSLFIFTLCSYSASAQNSLLVNFGNTSCSSPGLPGFSLIKNPLTPASSVLTSCNLSAQLPDFYNVFIAYNPFDHRIYIADIRTAVTKIWILDMGLSADIICPGSIPIAPDHSYSYISNNFEFDNNGDLWSLSAYNSTTGRSNIDKFDVNTGNVISSSVLQFPTGNFPSTIASGDITILPNGRMFAVLGIPSKLYEIFNYGAPNSNAVYLQSTPKACYGIAYLNGELELTGFDGAGCYRYDYSISNNTPGPEFPFQNHQTPVDNTSISPTIGSAKLLVNASRVNSNTYDLLYSIYTKNLGNIGLKDITLTDDLGAAFGAANVSNVSAALGTGPHPMGITVNPSYDGVTNTQLLNPGGLLDNQTVANNSYYFYVSVRCRVTNLNPAVTYLNSAVSGGSIGSAAHGTRVNVSDSSNNGGPASTDPNNDSNAGEPGENVPTPFNFGLLPVHFLDITAILINKEDGDIRWRVAVPTEEADYFEPEYSTDAIHWTTLSQIHITDHNRGDYGFIHPNIPTGIVFYRVKQADLNGSYIYSKTVILRTGKTIAGYTIYPNPADDHITVVSSYAFSATAEVYDAIGRLIKKTTILTGNQQIDCSLLPPGTYLLKIKDDEGVTAKKILIRH